MSIIYISLLNCHVIFKLAENGLWKHCSPPHVSPMYICSKCYPRSLITRMSFYSGSTKNQTLKTHKNRDQLRVLKVLYLWEQIKGKPFSTDGVVISPISPLVLITPTVGVEDQKFINRQSIRDSSMAASSPVVFSSMLIRPRFDYVTSVCSFN